MDIRIDRRARRHLNSTGGLLTVEARARTGCMVTRQVEAVAGKPENPADYAEVDIRGITVFVRGSIDNGDGTLQPSPGAVPPSLRVTERGGRLTVDVG